MEGMPAEKKQKTARGPPAPSSGGQSEMGVASLRQGGTLGKRPTHPNPAAGGRKPIRRAGPFRGGDRPGRGRVAQARFKGTGAARVQEGAKPGGAGEESGDSSIPGTVAALGGGTAGGFAGKAPTRSRGRTNLTTPEKNAQAKGHTRS